MKAFGSVFKYGDNVDTDVIIPARHLATTDPKGLAAPCMEDIDTEFVKNVKDGDIIFSLFCEIFFYLLGGENISLHFSSRPPQGVCANGTDTAALFRALRPCTRADRSGIARRQRGAPRHLSGTHQRARSRIIMYTPQLSRRHLLFLTGFRELRYQKHF